MTMPKQKKINKLPFKQRYAFKLPWITREAQRKRRAKNKAWRNLSKLRLLSKENEQDQHKFKILENQYIPGKKSVSSY